MYIHHTIFVSNPFSTIPLSRLQAMCLLTCNGSTDPWLENPHDLHRGNTLVNDLRYIQQSYFRVSLFISFYTSRSMSSFPLLIRLTRSSPPPSPFPSLPLPLSLLRDLLAVYRTRDPLSSPDPASAQASALAPVPVLTHVLSSFLPRGVDQLALVLEPLRADTHRDTGYAGLGTPTVPVELLRSLAHAPVPTNESLTANEPGPGAGQRTGLGAGLGSGGYTNYHAPVNAPSFDFNMTSSPGPSATTALTVKTPTSTSHPSPDLASPPLTNAQISTILWCVHNAHGLGPGSGLATGSVRGVAMDGAPFSQPLPRIDKGSDQGSNQHKDKGSSSGDHKDKGSSVGLSEVAQLPLFDGSGGADASQRYLTSFHHSLLLLGTPPVDCNTVIGQVTRYTWDYAFLDYAQIVSMYYAHLYIER